MNQFGYFSGVLTRISDFWTGEGQQAGCNKLFSVADRNESVVNFVVTPETYFVDNVMMKEGDPVIGFYDANAPVPLIYPPQYRAIVMAKLSPLQNVMVSHFDSQLVSSDGSLKLNLSPLTRIIMENGQAFTGSIANRNLVVLYGATTRSIPAQTTPYKIIVLCRAV